jgi:hypothetical protein
MNVVRRGSRPRAKGIADVIRGSAILLPLLSACIVALSTPVYFAASFIAGLGAPTWLTAALSIGLCIGELSGIAFIPVYLDRRDDRREREEIEKPTPVTARAQLSGTERELVGRPERRWT